MSPRRIQRKRTRGWRMPPGAVYVGRPSKWGNPFAAGEPVSIIYYQIHHVAVIKTAAEAVDLFRKELMRSLLKSDDSVDVLIELRGKDLACWCALDKPCHADILLKLANA